MPLTPRRAACAEDVVPILTGEGGQLRPAVQRLSNGNAEFLARPEIMKDGPDSTEYLLPDTLYMVATPPQQRALDVLMARTAIKAMRQACKAVSREMDSLILNFNICESTLAMPEAFLEELRKERVRNFRLEIPEYVATVPANGDLLVQLAERMKAVSGGGPRLSLDNAQVHVPTLRLLKEKGHLFAEIKLDVFGGTEEDVSGTDLYKACRIWHVCPEEMDIRDVEGGIAAESGLPTVREVWEMMQEILELAHWSHMDVVLKRGSASETQALKAIIAANGILVAVQNFDEHYPTTDLVSFLPDHEPSTAYMELDAALAEAREQIEVGQEWVPPVRS